MSFFFILRTYLKIQPKSAERILNLFTKNVLIRLRGSEGSKMATAMWIKMADPRLRLPC